MGFLLLIVLFVGISYFVSLRLHPWAGICGKCNGTGRQRGAFYTYSDRACTRCGGQARRGRLGVRVFHPNAPVWGESKPREVAVKRAQKWGR